MKTFAEFWPISARCAQQIGLKLARTRQQLRELRRHLAKFWLKSDQSAPNLVGLAWIWLDIGQIWTHPGDMLPKSCRTRSSSDETRPTPVELEPSLAGSGRFRRTSPEQGATPSEQCPTSATCAWVRLAKAGFRPKCHGLQPKLAGGRHGIILGDPIARDPHPDCGTCRNRLLRWAQDLP